MKELVKKFNFLTFNKEEIELMSKDDLQMAYIYHYIKDVYKYEDYKVHYTTYLGTLTSSPYDLFLIEINGIIVRYIEIVNDYNIRYNTVNMSLAKDRIKTLEGRYK